MNTKSNSISYTKKFKWAENAGENNQLKIVENEEETISQREIRLLDEVGFKGQKDNQTESELIRASDFNFIFYSISKEFKTIQDLAVDINQTFNNVVSDLSGVDYRLKAVETWKSDHETKYNTLNTLVNEHSNKIKTLEDWKPQISKQVSDHISNTNTMINSVRTKNNEQDQKLKELSDQSTVTTSSVANLKSEVDNTKKKVNILQVSTDSLSNNVQTIKNQTKFISPDSSRFNLEVPGTSNLTINSSDPKIKMGWSNHTNEIKPQEISLSTVELGNNTSTIFIKSNEIQMVDLKIVDNKPKSLVNSITSEKIKTWDNAVTQVKKVNVDELLRSLMKKISITGGWEKVYESSNSYTNSSKSKGFSDSDLSDEISYIKIGFTNSRLKTHYTNVIYNTKDDVDYKQIFTFQVWNDSDSVDTPNGDRQIITFKCYDGTVEIKDALRVYDGSAVGDWKVTELKIYRWVTKLVTDSSGGGGHSTTR